MEPEGTARKGPEVINIEPSAQITEASMTITTHLHCETMGARGLAQGARSRGPRAVSTTYADAHEKNTLRTDPHKFTDESTAGQYDLRKSRRKSGSVGRQQRLLCTEV